MAGQTIAAEVAKQTGGQAAQRGGGGNEPASLAIVRQYWTQLKAMLPSHVVPEAWYAGVFAALYRNKDLMNAANRNPESLMFALMDAARWGLDPGTKQYYLTPRPNRRAPNGVEVLGIMGYQGQVELMYRAGAISSVIVEVVRENDAFSYRPGDAVPTHEIDWKKTWAERGPLLLAYGYARMKDGAYSRVAVVTRDDIARAKAASPTANKDYSPWKTDEEAMWKKTAAHRLEAWVPTSAEFVAANKEILIEQARAKEQAKVLQGQVVGQLPPPPDAAMVAAGGNPLGAGDPAAIAPTGDFHPASGFAPAIEGGDEGAAYAGDPDDADQPVIDAGAGEVGDEEPEGMATQGQHRKIMGALGKTITSDAHRHAVFSAILARPVTSGKDLTATEADQVYEQVKGWAKAGELAARVAAMDPAAVGGGAGEPVGAPAGGRELTPGEELPAVGTQAWHDAGHPDVTDGGRVVTVPELLNGDCGFCEENAMEGK